jgi:hypothetical protein
MTSTKAQFEHQNAKLQQFCQTPKLFLSVGGGKKYCFERPEHAMHYNQLILWPSEFMEFIGSIQFHHQFK